MTVPHESTAGTGSPALGYEQLRQDLTHVYWMGGSPCSGKSSIAPLLAEPYGLQTYHVDDAYNRRHRHQIVPGLHPTLHKWTTNPWNALWMQPPDVLLAEAIASYGEHFRLILADLLALTRSAPVLVEGTALLPDRVLDVLCHPHHAIWIVPTEQFQREHYPRRGPWVQGILSACDDPGRALRNWMGRDVAFARWVTRRAGALGLALLEVDGEHDISHNAARVAAHFRLS